MSHAGPHPDAGPRAPVRTIHAETRTIMLLLQAPEWGAHPLPYPDLAAAVECVVAQIEWSQVILPEERARIEWEFLGAAAARYGSSAALRCVWHDWPLVAEPSDPEEATR